MPIQLPARLQAPIRMQPCSGESCNCRNSSGFGMRTHPIHGSLIAHMGVDIAAPKGTTIRSTTSGRVVGASNVSGYGKQVRISHGPITILDVRGNPAFRANDMVTTYSHMAKFAVRVGQMVQAGTPLGIVGMTGRTTGPHVHYEISASSISPVGMNQVNCISDEGQYVCDPYQLSAGAIPEESDERNFSCNERLQ